MEPEKKKLPKKRKLQQEEDKPLGAIPTNVSKDTIITLD
jgi:hypothetical protein